jgi:tellurium resistance protein TerD
MTRGFFIMVDIPMRSSAPVTRQTVLSINERKVEGAKTTRTITSINHTQSQTASKASSGTTSSMQHTAMHPSAMHPASTPASKPLPPLVHMVQKGQKTPLENSGKLTSIKACLGWNVKNPACDVDVSAFLLGSSGKVIGDSWFVFYGQTESPDHSTVFHADGGADREIISVDFTRLDPSVARIVFVLTINEAFEKNLNFGMLEDAYIRIMDPAGTELVSFKMDEYYTNVTSMMIGELYLHNGAWKFNAIGNGVAKDLAGLCSLYGVQVI